MIRIRQIVFAAANLDDASAQLEAAFGLGTPFHDPGVGEFGLVNAVYPVGDQFIEVVSPDPTVSEPCAVDRFLARNGGPGAYMLILQTDRPIDAVRGDLDGVRIVYEAVAPGIVGLHLHPLDVDGTIVSIDRTDDWNEWPWAGPDWRNRRGSAPPIDAITAADFETADPVEFVRRWQGWFGGRVDGATLHLDDTDILAQRAIDGATGPVGFRFRAAPGIEPFEEVVLGVACSVE